MIAVTGGNVLTIAKGALNGATVLIDGGKIKAVGKKVAIPKKAKRINAKGKIVMPGMIDAHCHLGVHVDAVGPPGHDVNEASDPVTPHLRALDGINPKDQALEDARKAGVTTICVAPGSANVIGGETVVLKTVGTVVDEMVVSSDSGLKIAFGENPKRVYGEANKMPKTRMGVAGLLRETIVKAINYKKGLKKEKKRDLKMEGLLKVLDGTMPFRAHAHQANDIVTAVRVAKEFNAKICIEHCTEGHEIADFLARENVPAIVGPNSTARVKVELKNRAFETPGVLARAGVKVAIMTDHPVLPIVMLPVCAALAVKHGMREEDALRAITLNAAEIIGVADRVGSIEKGKDADIIILSKHPFDIMHRVERVFIGGKEI